MTNEQIIEQTVIYVQQELQGAEGGHDWWHIQRVWNNAKQIGKGENVNQLVVELGALLHDIADSKFHGGDETIGPKKAEDFLSKLSLAETVITHVKNIISNISFKGGHFTQAFHSPELAVVQDADRLDALGAIGIARAFNYGGFKNRTIHDPLLPPNLQMTKEEYKNSTAPTINHFYEKLLLLKDKMNTETGKQLAKNRHHYMEDFLSQFYAEWEGEK